jgi:hypothetical protein
MVDRGPFEVVRNKSFSIHKLVIIFLLRQVSIYQRQYNVQWKKDKRTSKDLQNTTRVACPWSVVLSGYSASSTTKTGRHDIAEILLKVTLSTKNQIKSNVINADIKSTGVPDTFLYTFSWDRFYCQI